MADVTVKRVEEIESVGGGGMSMTKLRASLGVSAFGIQLIDMEPNAAIPEHSHAGTIDLELDSDQARRAALDDQQEEVYALLRGSATLVVGDEEHPLEPGTFARIGPNEVRKVVAGPDGAQILALGGMPGRPYEPPPFTELSG